jgi:hypothetical protein
MNNMRFYDELRAVPSDALKKISGGRLNGMSNINPMWRLRRMTEVFGPCGIGWKYEITDKRIENGTDGEMVAVVDVAVFIRDDNEWSAPIPGTGGSLLVAKESKGLRTSDEAFKMALTDALGVAMKALGVAADVYFDEDPTKYDREDPTAHSLLVIGRRIEQLVTKKINEGTDLREILAKLKISEKQFNMYMNMAKSLDAFEKAVREL